MQAKWEDNKLYLGRVEAVMEGKADHVTYCLYYCTGRIRDCDLIKVGGRTHIANLIHVQPTLQS